MTRLLPEHPQGTPAVTPKQLLGISRVYLGGCWVAGLCFGDVLRDLNGSTACSCFMGYPSGSAGLVDLAAIVKPLCRQSSHS